VRLISHFTSRVTLSFPGLGFQPITLDLLHLLSLKGGESHLLENDSQKQTLLIPIRPRPTNFIVIFSSQFISYHSVKLSREATEKSEKIMKN